MSETAFVSIGSNLDPLANVARALSALRESFGELRLSNSYECGAVGFDGPPFLNLVVGFETDLSPGEVVAQLHAIEGVCGRVRGGERFSSRPMDLDLLLLGDRAGDFEGVILPRDEITEAAFVLIPLAELAPHRRDPASGLRYAELSEMLDVGQGDLRLVELDLESSGKRRPMAP